MKEFIISQSQAQEILNYLICQPFKDVAKLVGILTNLQENKPVPPVAIPDEKKG